MTEKMEHFDHDPDLRVSSKLSADLDALFKPQLAVPPEVDRAVLDRADRHFAGLEPAKRPGFRLVGLWRVAAAAAVVILAFSLNLKEKPAPTTHRFELAKTPAVDIDQNGRVDILDAFKLARQIELAGSTEAILDINGDGLVNRDDVDMVALAAVSLDKGV
ncbi:MAG: hypothetical protein CEE38_12395 [Planctomycetes bacterium B3_Pla]|nr:MAG: hypothetical protein CEE38_12395 [Planctomycetes bacterium B3_Pla]